MTSNGDEQMIIDSILAFVFQVDTKRINEQVRRNIERFPSHFMIQMEENEVDSLRSQIATLKNQSLKRARGEHFKYRPFVFTEHGVAMLSSVLKSPTAIDTSFFKRSWKAMVCVL